MKIFSCLLLLGLSGPLGLMMASAAPTHPLDSLTTEEYQDVVRILKDGGRVTDSTRFAQVSLLPPSKAFVKSWTTGDSFPRMAVGYLKDGVATYKTEIDLVGESITSFESSEGEPMFLLEEILAVSDIALKDPLMISGLAARGLTPEEVYCLPLSAGTFGDPIEVGRRLMKVPCYLIPSGSNWWAKPVEGLLAFVDLNTKEVLEVTDTGAVSIPEDPWGYTAAEVSERFGGLRGGKMLEPEENPEFAVVTESLQVDGSSFNVDGWKVEWDIW